MNKPLEGGKLALEDLGKYFETHEDEDFAHIGDQFGLTGEQIRSLHFTYFAVGEEEFTRQLTFYTKTKKGTE